MFFWINHAKSAYCVVKKTCVFLAKSPKKKKKKHGSYEIPGLDGWILLMKIQIPLFGWIN